MNIFDLERFSENAFRVKLTYVDICGDLNAGILLGQIIYWFLPNKEGRSKLGATYKGRLALAKARNEWYEEIRLTERQYDRAVAILKEKGFVDVANSMFNGSRTPFIMLNEDVVMSHIIGINKSVTPVTHFVEHRYDGKGNNGMTDNVTPLTETTTKITTETTTNNINTLVSTNVDDTKVEKSKYKYSDEDMVLSKLLFQYIRNLDAKAKEPNFEYWANAVRLMREVDKRSYEEIKEVIIWCQNDDFWQGNILSTTKLRQQFSKLLIRMNKERGAASGQQSWQQAPRSANQDKVARESKNSGFYW